jgi:hypothetical protein
MKRFFSVFVAVIAVFAFSGFTPMAEDGQMFNADGTYAITKDALKKGAKFNFYGYDWRVVKVSGKTATFWMDSPYTTSKFNPTPTPSATGSAQTGANTFNNGYTSATWGDNQTLGKSTIATLLSKKETDLSTLPGWNKVKAGSQGAELNEDQNTQLISWVGYATVPTAEDTAKKLTEHMNWVKNSFFIANYSIANQKLWLPSYEEVKDSGVWGLTNTDRNWTDTTVSAATYAWLRSPFTGREEVKNSSGEVVLSKVDMTNTRGRLVAISNEHDRESIHYNWVDYSYGVRPALHIDITSLPVSDNVDDNTDGNTNPNPDDGDNTPGDNDNSNDNNNNNNDNSDNNDNDNDNNNDNNSNNDNANKEPATAGSEVLRAIFIIVCVVGGLAIAIVLVICYKDRKNSKKELLVTQ